jgi:hypothetical protein
MIRRPLALAAGRLACILLVICPGTGSLAQQILGNQPDPGRTSVVSCGCSEQDGACTNNSNCCGSSNTPPDLVCSSQDTCKPPGADGDNCGGPQDCLSQICLDDACQPTSCSCQIPCFDSAIHMGAQAVCTTGGVCVDSAVILIAGLQELQCSGNGFTGGGGGGAPPQCGQQYGAYQYAMIQACPKPTRPLFCCSHTAHLTSSARWPTTSPRSPAAGPSRPK